MSFLKSLLLFFSSDPSQSSKEQFVYEFNMPALTALLRKQYETTPTASYFNIDILKYHVCFPLLNLLFLFKLIINSVYFCESNLNASVELIISI